MFPSKLYDLQLTPSLSKFNADRESEKSIGKCNSLLKDANLEICGTGLDLMKAISMQLYGSTVYSEQLSELCGKNPVFDDLDSFSAILQRKIVVYEVSSMDLRCQIYNQGFKKKLLLARYMNHFYAVSKLGYSQLSQYLREMILSDIIIPTFGAPQRKHKRSYSDPFKFISDQKDNRKFKNAPVSPGNISRVSWQDSKIMMRDEYIDEINQEGDLLIQECFSEMNVPQNDLISSLNLNMPEGTNILSNVRYLGSLKFYDESRSYGFIIMDIDGSDVFVHCDDLTKAGMSKEYLRTSKQGNLIRFSFLILEYFGKYNKSRKAVDLQIIPF